ncbi:hypothetical protein Q9295_10135 [Xinfangfangia sp. CPCC 101601]|uniref:Chitin-binding type-3 domain-containing protein n=1 Tax=Pseudogemmobacter lacusdianii TaxID=3069608 RepID=A0ABU0VYB6_9RHOB|nr:hypothetical protein [Xinfangfangia sp. CPCC 101601]MDQ2066736.1 hypothetical protein [Xinfangfangia sp. CPCC 101601]
MPQTDFKIGTAVVTATGGSSLVWANPGNVIVDSTSTATSAAPKNSATITQQLWITGFPPIPSGSRIVGVEMKMRVGVAGADGAAHVLQLTHGGVLIGSNQSSPTIPVSIVNNPVLYELTVGGAADLWGVSNLTDVMVNSPTFGVVCAFTAPIGDNKTAVSLSWVKLNIHYEPNDGVFVKDSGVWKVGTGWVKDGGIWKPAKKYLKEAGVWKL